MTHFILPEQVNKILEMLYDEGFDAYVVGGAVRDFISGAHPHDFDVATSAVPEDMLRVFDCCKVVPTGIKHGTLTVIYNSMPVEVTTYRTDGVYTDARHPDNVCFVKNIKDDLSRRDFTVNAIAYSPREGIVDPFGGKDDIKNKIIRSVGNPKTRFLEDALRILRALRFSSQTGFEIEEKTIIAADSCKELLQQISAERKYAELAKMLCGKNALNVLLKYPEILGVVVPDILPMVGFDQHNRHHIYTVWEHTARAVAAAKPDVITRLALLLHDVGKPHCHTTDEFGEGHFKGHATISESIAANVLRGFKTDNQTYRDVTLLVKYHDILLEPRKNLIKRWFGKIGKENMYRLLDIKRADNLAQAPQYDRSKQYDELESVMNSVVENDECFSLRSLAANGSDVMTLSITGRDIGSALQLALDAVIDGKIENRKEDILNYIKGNF